MRLSISAVSFNDLGTVFSTAKILLDILYRLRALGTAECPSSTSLTIEERALAKNESIYVRFTVYCGKPESRPESEGPQYIDVRVPEGARAGSFAFAVLCHLEGFMIVASANRWRHTATREAADIITHQYVYRYVPNTSEL